MPYMKYGLAIVMALIAAILPAPAQGDTGQVRTRIAVIVPLSGPAASVGVAFKNGMTLAQELIPAEIAGRMDFVFEDDRLDSATSVSAYKKLTSSQAIDVVFNMSSGTGKALAPLVEKAGIPLLAVASDFEVARNRKYVMNFWVTPEEEARVLKPALMRRNWNRLAVICTVHSGAFAVRDALREQGKGDLSFVLDTEVLPDDRDFRTQIARIASRRTEIDAIMPFLLPGQLAVFTKQVRAAGIALPFTGFEYFEDVNELRLSEGALEGVVYVNASDGDGSFLQKYRKRFPGASTYGAANGHDALLLIAEALKTGTGAEHLNKFLHSVKDFSGSLGNYSASGDNRFTLPAALKQIRGESFDLLSE